MRLPTEIQIVVDGATLQTLQDHFRLAGYRRFPASTASRADGHYNVWGTSHVMARVLLALCLEGRGIVNRDAHSARG